MTQECSTTRLSTPVDIEPDENTFEEPGDACLRRELGVRPIHYVDTGKRGHADQRPCPSWCWVGQEGEEYGHEIDYTNPMVASHSMEPSPSIVTSLYPGRRPQGNDRAIQTATLEPRLEQSGQDEPVVNMARRMWEGDEQRYDEAFLRLTVTDARELVVALSYLIEAAERG